MGLFHLCKKTVTIMEKSALQSLIKRQEPALNTFVKINDKVSR